jgi:hypothetical protein
LRALRHLWSLGHSGAAHAHGTCDFPQSGLSIGLCLGKDGHRQKATAQRNADSGLAHLSSCSIAQVAEHFQRSLSALIES